jgi:hypothetical protein
MRRRRRTRTRRKSLNQLIIRSSNAIFWVRSALMVLFKSIRAFANLRTNTPNDYGFDHSTTSMKQWIPNYHIKSLKTSSLTMITDWIGAYISWLHHEHQHRHCPTCPTLSWENSQMTPPTRWRHSVCHRHLIQRTQGRGGLISRRSLQGGVTQEGVTVTDVKALIFWLESTNSLMSDPTNVLRLQASTLHKGQQDDRSGKCAQL